MAGLVGLLDRPLSGLYSLESHSTAEFRDSSFLLGVDVDVGGSVAMSCRDLGVGSGPCFSLPPDCVYILRLQRKGQPWCGCKHLKVSPSISNYTTVISGSI